MNRGCRSAAAAGRHSVFRHRPLRVRHDRGAAAVEMALVLPLLLLLTFGIIDFGRMLNAQITITEAAREAARAESLGGDPAARANAVAGRLGPVTVTARQSCPSPVDVTRDAEMEIAYPFSFVTPVGALGGLLGAGGTMTISGRGVMPCLQ